MDSIRISRRLSKQISQLTFAEPVTHVYNPLDYARRSHEAYLKRFGEGQKEIVLVGMNPGPWGMAQTGVPFGEISMVRDWMGIEEQVGRPSEEHPKRPIQGFACERREVSGARLWGWAQDRFGNPENFFKRFFVWNYCPLSFMLETGRNFTPNKLPAEERAPLFEICDIALKSLIDELRPDWVIGVGKFAEGRANVALAGCEVRVGTVLHPSPASPAANRGWAEQAEKKFNEYGIRLH